MKTLRHSTNQSRRKFILSSVAAGGGLAIGMKLPFMQEAKAAQSAATAGAEVNHWIVVKPDDTTVIRIARAEMGQGTHTGLAQLVAEELECDWKKVTLEPITAGQNLSRKRVWGDMSTGGSRGIRTSQDYLLRSGAAARMMLLQAAADEWKVTRRGVDCFRGRDPARRFQSLDDVRQGRSGSRKVDAAGDEGDQAPESPPVEGRRQTDETSGHGAQTRWQPGLRDRRKASRHVERGDQTVSGIRRQAREVRRSEDREDARCEARGQSRRSDSRCRRGHMVARTHRAGSVADRVGRR